jgi:hypothetical protein
MCWVYGMNARANGIQCTACGRKKLKVVDSRSIPSGIRRRRECVCGKRITTYEIQLPDLSTMFRDRLTAVIPKRGKPTQVVPSVNK